MQCDLDRRYEPLQNKKSEDFDKDKLTSFAGSVMERFANPFLEHHLLSISLNSVSKFKARVLPTILEYIDQNGMAPSVLSFSFASLMHFYSGKKKNGETHSVSDDKDVVEKFTYLWSDLENERINSQEFVEGILSDISFWGQDLNFIPTLREKVLEHFVFIKDQGICKSIEGIL